MQPYPSSSLVFFPPGALSCQPSSRLLPPRPGNFPRTRKAVPHPCKAVVPAGRPASAFSSRGPRPRATTTFVPPRGKTRFSSKGRPRKWRDVPRRLISPPPGTSFWIRAIRNDPGKSRSPLKLGRRRCPPPTPSVRDVPPEPGEGALRAKNSWPPEPSGHKRENLADMPGATSPLYSGGLFFVRSLGAGGWWRF